MSSAIGEEIVQRCRVDILLMMDKQSGGCSGWFNGKKLCKGSVHR